VQDVTPGSQLCLRAERAQCQTDRSTQTVGEPSHGDIGREECTLSPGAIPLPITLAFSLHKHQVSVPSTQGDRKGEKDAGLRLDHPRCRQAEQRHESASQGSQVPVSDVLCYSGPAASGLPQPSVARRPAACTVLVLPCGLPCISGNLPLPTFYTRIYQLTPLARHCSFQGYVGDQHREAIMIPRSEMSFWASWLVVTMQSRRLPMYLGSHVARGDVPMEPFETILRCEAEQHVVGLGEASKRDYLPKAP
jgi:hypothetical protein